MLKVKEITPENVKQLGRRQSARNPRLEVIDHVPDAVDLSSLDDFEGLEPTEGIVRRVEPLSVAGDPYSAGGWGILVGSPIM